MSNAPYYVSHHKEGQFYKATTQDQIPATTKRPFRPKLQRQNAIIDRTMRKRLQKETLHP